MQEFLEDGSQYQVAKNELLHKILMDNQHRQILGYRELNEAEIVAMNEVKLKGAELRELVDNLRAQKDLDQRWVSIGATELQQGLMALTRAITKPTFF